MNNKNFYTFKGYQLNYSNELTSSMEDYIEMLCRMRENNPSVRVSDLAAKLNVKSPSVTKMIEQLNKSGYTQSRKYGEIFLTPKGLKMGEYLLYRHNVVHAFLCVLNNSENELEQTEKIEHFLNVNTVQNMEKLTEKMRG